LKEHLATLDLRTEDGHWALVGDLVCHLKWAQQGIVLKKQALTHRTAEVLQTARFSLQIYFPERNKRIWCLDDGVVVLLPSVPAK